MPTQKCKELLDSVLVVSFVQDQSRPLKIVSVFLPQRTKGRTCMYRFSLCLPLFDQIEELPRHDRTRV